jgi:hypothetical protein
MVKSYIRKKGFLIDLCAGLGKCRSGRAPVEPGTERGDPGFKDLPFSDLDNVLQLLY